jgi:hypothetical protein
MENTNNRNIWISGGLVLLVLAGIFFLIMSKNNNNTQNPASTQTSSDTNALEPQSTLDTSGTPVKGVTPVSISYADALVKYADRRIQLDKNCQAIPNTVTYKDNTGIMIDNRSPNARTVKVGTTYSIKPYGFRIIILPNVTAIKSKTILVDCDSQQNVATILVQE